MSGLAATADHATGAGLGLDPVIQGTLARCVAVGGGDLAGIALALFADPTPTVRDFLASLGVTPEDGIELTEPTNLSADPDRAAARSPQPRHRASQPAAAAPSAPATTATPAERPHVLDMVAAARAGQYPPCTGRDVLVNEMLSTLTRMSKNSVVLLGDAGVGKTAVVEEIARKFAADDVPAALRGRPLWEIDLAEMLANTPYRGQFESRMVELLTAAADERAILFIDEAHMLFGAGTTTSSTTDSAQMIKRALARGRVTVIAATTHEEYRKTFARDAAMRRRLAPIDVSEPTGAALLDILTTAARALEAHHGVTYTPRAIDAAAELSRRHLQHLRNPDAALDVLDQAAATLQGAAPAITPEHVAAAVAHRAGIPVPAVRDTSATALRDLSEHLQSRVVGQYDATTTLARAVRRRRVGAVQTERPASFLFAGPTGVGKTELAKALAETLYGPNAARDGSLIRIDMGEFSERHSVTRLFGAPPGYVGHEAGGQLTEAVRRRPASVVLLDEVDKAHPDIFDALLAVLEDGVMTDGAGQQVRFTDCIVIMTSNHGTGQRSSTGFADAGTAREEFTHRAMKESFRPEFLNRLDEVVVFQPLQAPELRTITQMHVDAMTTSLASAGHVLHVSNEVVNFLADQSAENPVYGAREVRRTVERVLGDAVADALTDLVDPAAGLIAQLSDGPDPARAHVLVYEQELVAGC